MSGYTAPSLTVFINKVDVRYTFMVFETFIHTAHESADVETDAEAEQAYSQTSDGDEVLRFVLQ
jgi:hypothetical protein